MTVHVTGAGLGNHGQADRLPPTLLRSSLQAGSRLDGSGGWERASRQRDRLKQR